MNKKLPTADMVNELAGASVFFQPPTQADQRKADQPETPQSTQALEPEKEVPVHEGRSTSRDTTVSRNRETMTPRKTQTITPGPKQSAKQHTQARILPPTHGDDPSEMLEEVRKMVRQLGKEAATHRFTVEEKRTIADLVYTYNRQGYKTSENEITRIAVNWLLLDFEERGEQSILAEMLELLHS